MRLNTKKLWPAVITFMLISSAHADSHDSSTSDLEDCLPCLEQNLVTPNQENCPPHSEQNLTKPDLENRLILIEKNLENCLKVLEQKQDLNGFINPPAMPLTRNGWDLQISADALLWQVQEDGLTYALSFDTQSDEPKAIALIKQKYNWGFRVGLDWTIPHDNWDIAATWTHLISNSRNNNVTRADLNAPNGFLFQMQGVNDNDAFQGFFTASSKYHNRLDQICLNTGREFFISKWVTLRPYLGLRSDWLRQRLHTSLFGNINTPDLILNTKQTNKWWGLGIESGLNMQLSFCGGFSIYGNIASAIEYGLQKLHTHNTGTDYMPPIDSFNNGLRTSYHICRPILDLQLGLGWDYNFCDDKFHFGLKLGWENHIYFNQSRFLNFQAGNLFIPGIAAQTAIYSEVQHGGDLTYQGWTLHASFDF